MIINQFRVWAQTAAPVHRAEGASALARAYLYSNFDEQQKHEALAVLTGFLDDSSPLVRRALADAFAESSLAPHHIVLGLADDQSSIAAIVLLRSPILSDAELIDCAASADDFAQSAIAARTGLSVSVSAALAEIGGPDSLVALAANPAAAIGLFSIHRMIERHGDHAELREALLARPDLPGAARVDLVAATMRALGAFVTERNWMSDERVERVGREAKDKAAIVIADSSRGWRGALDLAAHLRKTGELTVGFVFRAILSGRIDLFKATLSELSGVPVGRIDGLTNQADSAGFAAVYRKAGLPLDLLSAFRVALRAARETDWTMAGSAGLSRRVIERVLTACDRINNGELDKLLVLLRRFEAEAAREEARIVTIAKQGDQSLAQSLQLNGPHGADANGGNGSQPLLLTDLDAGDHHMPHARRRAPPRREPTLFTIDMAALEAELCAA